MPKNKRSFYHAEPPKPPVPSRQEVAKKPTWRVEEKLRFWCPLCGMVADADRLDDSPHPVKVMLQRYGGRFPGGKGYMEYVPVTDRERDKIISQIEKIIPKLPGYLGREEVAPAREPESFFDWYEEASRLFPDITQEYSKILHALSLALAEVAEMTVSPEELSSRFHDPLVHIKPTSSFSNIASSMGQALLRRAERIVVPDVRTAKMVAWDLAQISVTSGVEEAAKEEIRKRGLRKGTNKYKQFIEEHAGKLLEAERKAFESAKERQLAELEKAKSTWKKEAEKALETKELLERDLDIVTGVYTLAGEKVPSSLISKIKETINELSKAEEIEELFTHSQQIVESRTFEDYMESYQKPILKEMWELKKEEAEEEHPDVKVLEEIYKKWSTAKRRNPALVRKDLERLTETDIQPALDALGDFEDIEREDYETYEEYKEARDEAWETFLDELANLEPGDLAD
jgi:hypothetical protein